MPIQWNRQSVDLPRGTVIGLVGSIEDCAAFVQSAGPSLKAAGVSALISSPEDPLLQQLADEVWWIEGEGIRQRGDIRELLPELVRSGITPASRAGDGRAEILSLETLDASEAPTKSLASGQDAAVRVRVRFNAAVAEPVVGIMIRTRIGMEVYGTNTELEKVVVGPCGSGDERTILFRFKCALCPGFYTLTVASHDPDGVWHDWLEDAASFTVSDTRYTAGVANLRARVEVS